LNEIVTALETNREVEVVVLDSAVDGAKNINALSVTDTYPGGQWKDQGYNWFSGS
jgi:DMSO/TMAO reductase YedYZ molybdopterin-dependent catalytic subunit